MAKLLKWFKYNLLGMKQVFQIDGHKLRFGSTLNDLKKKRIDLEISDDLRSASILSKGFQFGLEYAYIEMECFAPNRPINKVSYWIATQESSRHSATVRAGHKMMQKELGKAVGNSNSLIERVTRLFAYGLVLEDGWTRWNKRDYSWEMSWFEKSRVDKEKEISGVLTQSWHDEIDAASQYVNSYKNRQKNYENVTNLIVLARISNDCFRRNFPLFLTREKRGWKFKVDRKLWEAQRALYNPNWYYTSNELVSKLKLKMTGELIVWRSQDGRFGVSTPCNTWIARHDEILLVKRKLSYPNNVKYFDNEEEIFLEGGDSIDLACESALFVYEIGGNREVIRFLSELKLIENVKIVESEIFGYYR